MIGTVSKSAASLVAHNVVHPVKINNVCCATLIQIPLFCQGKHMSGAVSGTGLNHQYCNRGSPKPQKGLLSEFLIHREWLEINIIKRENIYTHNMNTLKKGCFAYGDQPKKLSIGCLQGNKGTFPLSQNHISLHRSITSAIATPFFISSLKMWPRSGNHRSVSLYSLLIFQFCYDNP